MIYVRCLVFTLLKFTLISAFSNHYINSYQNAIKTPEPIIIETENLKNITTFPLIFVGGLTEKALLRNTGRSVEVVLHQPTTVTLITSGILGANIYIYRKCRFYWTDNFKGVAGTTENHKNGTPLEVSLLYYNLKYGSFHNALNHRDGLVEVIIRVNVGPIPNPLFYPFEYFLKRIRKPGESKELIIAIAFIWYVLFPPTASYVAYPGSYTDEITNKEYYCTTTIVPPLYPYHFISDKQFAETFGSILGYDDKPLSNKRQQVSRYGREVVQSSKVLAIISFGGPIQFFSKP